MKINLPRLLPLECLRISPTNPKKPMGSRYLAGLEASLARFGFVGLFVVADNGDGSFEILDGNTRYEELVASGAYQVPCVVLDVPPDERSLFVLSYDRNRKLFDEDAVLEQLKALAQKGHDLATMATLTAQENLQRLLHESERQATAAMEASQTTLGRASTQASLVLYGPAEDIDAVRQMIKRIRGRMTDAVKLRTTVEQADAYLRMTDEQFLMVFLSALKRVMDGES